jgi:hypothetical protein
MKSFAAIVILLLISAFLADRVVRIENHRYALYVGLCEQEQAPSQRWGCSPEACAGRRNPSTHTDTHQNPLQNLRRASSLGARSPSANDSHRQ